MDAERPPDDWIADLRAAWRAEPAPASDRPLAEEDPQTRRTVDWVRQAWMALPVPAARAPYVTRSAIRSRARWRYAAAAAALLLALGVPLALGAWRRAHRPVAPPAHVAEAGPASSGAPHAPAAGVPPQAPAPPVTPAASDSPSAPASPAATIVAIDEHHLELRSGPVRLYLLTDPPSPRPEDLR